MDGDTINLFMWGFQRHFRINVESAVADALGNLGAPIEPVVFLIGLLRDEGEGHPICIEPENGPVTPEDFKRLAVISTDVVDNVHR